MENIETRIGYSVAEAATLSGLSRATIYRLIRSGTLRSVKLGGRRIVKRQFLEELFDAAEPSSPSCAAVSQDGVSN